MRRWRIALLVLVLAATFFWRLWFTPDGFLYRPNALYSDLTITHWPNALFVRDSLARWGQGPLWRSLILGGIRRAIQNTNRLIDGGAWWLRKPFNANSVMTASAIVGALAYADVDKDLAFETLRRAVPALSLSIGSLGSDGGWMEGYTYWDYATRYMAYGLSALETTLGGTFGLDAALSVTLAAAARCSLSRRAAS